VQALTAIAHAAANTSQRRGQLRIGPPPKRTKRLKSYTESDNSIIGRSDIGKGFTIFYNQRGIQKIRRLRDG
jgi:hypothetical protein